MLRESDFSTKDEYLAALRDWFAGMAMQGWLASYGDGERHPTQVDGGVSHVSEISYAMADAMLKAREAK